MTDLRKAAEMALEAFEILDNRGGLGLDFHEYIRTKIEALRQALAQTEQEPVECMCGLCKLGKREWVGLTDEEIITHFKTNVDTGSLLSFADGVRYAEAKLKEKNGD